MTHNGHSRGAKTSAVVAKRNSRCAQKPAGETSALIATKFGLRKPGAPSRFVPSHINAPVKLLHLEVLTEDSRSPLNAFSLKQKA